MRTLSLHTTSIKIVLLLTISVSIVTTGFSQTHRLSGRIFDQESGQPLSGAVIQEVVRNRELTETGVVSDNSGRFTISSTTNFPVTLSVSFLGYSKTTISVNRREASNVRVNLAKDLIALDNVLIQSNKYTEEQLRSDLSFDRISIEDIAATPSFSYYDAVAGLSEVDVATQGIQNKSVNTRGFNTPGNTRFLQLIDGVDNQAPGFNFALGEFASLSELDVESVELFPGTSSYKYGPGATNGALIITSKSPFDYTGLTAQMKLASTNLAEGIEGYGNFGATPLLDLGVRYAETINDKWAYKTTVSMLRGTDWPANNIDNIGRGHIFGLPSNSPGYNGVNVYGDEVSSERYLFLYDNHRFLIYDFQEISRTGYPEDNLFNYEFTNVKVNSAIHFRPNEKLEVIAQGNIGVGSTFYTGDNRTALRNFKAFQTKLELRGSNFSIKGYTNQQRSGDSYDAKFLAQHLNERAANSAAWFQFYDQGHDGLFASRGLSIYDHFRTRAFIDEAQLPTNQLQPRYEPGTDRFDELRRELINTVGFDQGAGFRDNSRFYHLDGTYQFSDQIDFVDLEIGASYRFYDPESGGNIFADFRGNDITMFEVGSYLSASKSILQENLTLNTSLRVDKNENFKARVTPRFSAVYEVQAKHFFRTSIQNGFRNPSLREQYQLQDLETNNLLAGGTADMLDLIDLPGNAFVLGIDEVFEDAVQASLTQSQFTFIQTGIPAIARDSLTNPEIFPPNLIQPQADFVNLDILRDLIVQEEDIREIRPERVTSFELGYRGVYLGESLVLDINYYRNQYRGFIGTIRYARPKTSPSTDLFIAAQQLGNTLERELYFVYSNAREDVTTQGISAKLDYAHISGWQLTGNASWAQLISDPEDPIIPGFNTPSWKLNFGVGHRRITERIGLRLDLKARPSFEWESNFEDGTVPSAFIADFQFNWTVPNLNSMLKFGVSNLTNNYYENTFGGPRVGALPYIQMTYNPSLY